ncbi:MAG: HsdR family type I site-specific deoxyribonuclease [Kiritimatiellae bacterium]|jgi:type I restriction enzyme R subunit|nr:HsdR family type I site-specific deoxyribonuclease [Kiritimatiellia bacterium]
MSKFTEEQLEKAIIELFEGSGYTHVKGETITRSHDEVLIKDDLRHYLASRYDRDGITVGEIESIIRTLEAYPSSDLYESNKSIMKMVSDGFLLKREYNPHLNPLPEGEDCFGSSPSGRSGDEGWSQRDLYIQLIDYRDLPEHRLPTPQEVITVSAEENKEYSTSTNAFKIVNQLEIVGSEKRIPDAILYINGLPLVVFEFKSATREDASVYDAYVQLTVRYRRDIPELFKYNAFCVISDGFNNKMGSFFSSYEFFNTWRTPDFIKTQLPAELDVDVDEAVYGEREMDEDGIYSLYSMVEGLFNQQTLRDVIRNFIYFPDTSNHQVKIVCRYPQYYATIKLYKNIKEQSRPHGDGKGGTYFGATGCGKSLIMLFLTRLLMRSVDLSSPTIVLITDRTDLDDQLSTQFTSAKQFIGDENIISVESRQHLRELLKQRKSGGVFLSTIQKFTEDIQLLTERNNVICISDEAHRTQTNVDETTKITKDGVFKKYGFAKYLHDSLPMATYVGFSGTPVDATYSVFGELVDSYTMSQSVKDKITVQIVYEGRAAKVLLDDEKIHEIDQYYEQCATMGTNEYQIEESKKASISINSILGDPDILKSIATDFINHYQSRVEEGATVKGKAIFVCCNRGVGWDLYNEIIYQLEEQGSQLNSSEIKMVMTRDKDDPKELYDILGTKEYRKELDKQFKSEKSSFKIAIVVDMWLTGFDVPFLDTIYIYKPIQRHSLIQTISRVNRRFEGKDKGLVVDYIGIKKQMEDALGEYGDGDTGGTGTSIQDIEKTVIIAKDLLDLLRTFFHKFDSRMYFEGTPMERLKCLNAAAEFTQATEKQEKWFMHTVRKLKLAYDICCGSEKLTKDEKEHIHFYIAIRSIIFKLTKGDSPDIALMNANVQKMIENALRSNGVEEIIKLCNKDGTIEIFNDEYLHSLCCMSESNTKLKLLMKLLKRAIEDFAKTNRFKSIEFSKEFRVLVDKYNARSENDMQRENIVNDFTDEIIKIFNSLKQETISFQDLGIDFEEKAFYDILKGLAIKYEFDYPEEQLLLLAKQVKEIVDDKAKYTDWSLREDIKAELKVDLIILLAKNKYPPIDRDEVYKEIFEQAENFKKHQGK